jgi:hypothetical protein
MPDSAVRKLAKRIERVTSEQKYFPLVDNTYSSISYNGTDFLSPISLVPQGDTDSTRDGDQLTLQSIHCRFAIKVSTTTPTFLRTVVFQWFPNSVPVYANIFLDQHNTSAAAISDYNHDLRSQFHILHDSLVAVDTVSHPSHVVNFKTSKGFRPKIQFSAGGTTGTNHIYAFAISDVASAGPQLVFYSDVKYFDS